MKDNKIKLILLINIQYKELIGLFIIISSTIFIQYIFSLEVLFGKLFKVNVFLYIVRFVQFDTGINLFGEFVHFIGLFIEDF